MIRVIDLFCGAGGASLGLRHACQELGLDSQLMAVNHWPKAVETHRANHQESVHLCEKVDQVDLTQKVFIDPQTGRTFKHKGRVGCGMHS